jgi:Holliday junction resolvase-like predicted endonuclease
MPEVQQYAELMRQVYQDFRLTQIKSQSSKAQIRFHAVKSNVVAHVEYTDEAEDGLRAAIIHARDMDREPPGANAFAGKNPQYANLQLQLDTIAVLTQEIHKELASSPRAATDAPDSATG